MLSWSWVERAPVSPHPDWRAVPALLFVKNRGPNTAVCTRRVPGWYNIGMRKPRAAAPKLHVGYVRVSTDDQAREGVSLADQEARIRAHAFARGTDLDSVIVDGGYSAKDLNRPGMRKLLGMIERGEVASVTVLKLDRLTRSVGDFARFLDLSTKRGFALVSVAETLDTASAGGRMVANIMMSVASWEREVIGERTASAMAHKRRQGQFCGGKRAPYGYRVVGDGIVPHKGEQKVLDMIHQARERGLSLRRIVDDLNGRDIPGPQGGLWHLSGLVSVLKSKTTAEAA
jgi:site-specific DNA recombinase